MLIPYSIGLMNFNPLNEKPPTVYALLQSIVNYDKPLAEQVSIKDLAREGHTTFFDFTYPLSKKINKDDFEVMILKKFMQRRIGTETLTSFKINLDVKLNEIMPIYNKMFDSLDGWDLFTDGELTETTSTDTLNNTTDTTNGGTSENKFSDTPQSQLTDIKDDKYLTEYTQTSDQSKSNIKANGTSTHTETVRRSPADKIRIYREFKENIDSIYTMIFADLEVLFYGIW